MAPNKSKRKHYTTDMKRKILKEYDAKPFKKKFEVLDKYGISGSSIANWKEKKIHQQPAGIVNVFKDPDQAVSKLAQVVSSTSAPVQVAKAARLVIRMFLEEKLSEGLAEELLAEIESK